ncbi:MAG: hypothetical protein J1F17_01770 [Oscillospiraceae bacterium]|nr:hypothetical protein [Oscillospiraceae bacterium]
MTEKEVYDYLQSLLPQGMQFVDPYLDELPQPLGDWAQMNVLNRSNIAWSQSRFLETNETGGVWAYDIERIYTIQFDFYGANAFDNAAEFQQNLQVSIINDENELMDFKSVGAIENRTFLMENKKYQRRYGFDVDLFVIDTITQTSPYFDKIKYKIVNRGNNFNKEND